MASSVNVKTSKKSMTQRGEKAQCAMLFFQVLPFTDKTNTTSCLNTSDRRQKLLTLGERGTKAVRYSVFEQCFSGVIFTKFLSTALALPPILCNDTYTTTAIMLARYVTHMNTHSPGGICYASLEVGWY